MADDYVRLLDRIGALPQEKLVRVTGLIALELTIQARDTYVPGSTAANVPDRLRMFNECQHFLMGILARAATGLEIDRPAFVGSLTALSRDSLIGDSVRTAIQRSERQTQPGGPGMDGNAPPVFGSTNGSISDVLAFLERLKRAHIRYSLADPTDGAIMVLMAVPGERWEVEFHQDGRVDVERFTSAGGVTGGEQLEDLFRRFGD